MLFIEGPYLWHLIRASCAPKHSLGIERERERGQKRKLAPEMLTFNHVINAATKEGLEEYNFPPFL